MKNFTSFKELKTKNHSNPQNNLSNFQILQCKLYKIPLFLILSYLSFNTVSRQQIYTYAIL